MTLPFDPETRNFSLTNALGCASAAQLAYAKPETADRTLIGEWGFESVKHYASPSGTVYDTQAFLATGKALVLVSFRGTEPKNIIELCVSNRHHRGARVLFGYETTGKPRTVHEIGRAHV